MADLPDSDSAILTQVDPSDPSDDAGPLPPSTLSSSSSSSSSSSLPWHRTSLRHLYIAACSLLVLLNLLSSLFERDGCEHNRWGWNIGYGNNALVHRSLSTVVYALLLLYLTAFIPHCNRNIDLHRLRSAHAQPSPSSSLPSASPAQHQLTFTGVTALLCVLLFAFAIYSLVSVLIGTTCPHRAYFAFVMALDCAVPLHLTTFLLTYAALHTLAHYRHRQGEGDLSSLTSLHLRLYAVASLLFHLNLCATLLHTRLIHDDDTLPQWVFACAYTVLYALHSLALLASLVYRLTLSPHHQHALLTAILNTLPPLTLTLLLTLALTTTTIHLLTTHLSFIFFALEPHVGGLAILCFVNLGATVVGVGGVGWAVVKREARVREFGGEVWKKVQGVEGQSTGIYANDP